jgi:hypothetical protein
MIEIFSGVRTAIRALKQCGLADFIHFERGGNVFRPSFPSDPSNLNGGDTAYFEVTGGVSVKPPLPKPIAGLLIRPEVRYDRALTTKFKAFNQNMK